MDKFYRTPGITFSVLLTAVMTIAEFVDTTWFGGGMKEWLPRLLENAGVMAGAAMTLLSLLTGFYLEMVKIAKEDVVADKTFHTMGARNAKAPKKNTVVSRALKNMI